jgi:hypothetical protein
LLDRPQPLFAFWFVAVETVVIAVTPTLVALSFSALGLHPAALVGRVSPWHKLPPNIRTTDDVRQRVEELLSRSPTLREQCTRIGMARQTYVSLLLSAAKLPSEMRARSTARRYRSGLLVVDVEIPPASQDFAELLAHELEHVTEFIERVDFKQLARARRSGVVQCGMEGSFESERARRAGRIVAAEVESHDPPGAGAVGGTAQWRPR